MTRGASYSSAVAAIQASATSIRRPIERAATITCPFDDQIAGRGNRNETLHVGSETSDSFGSPPGLENPAFQFSFGHERGRTHGGKHPGPHRLWRLQLMQFWRTCRRRYAVEAASGEGARRYGGRWNSRGVRMVYASTSLSLAAVETFVNLEPNLRPADLVSIEGAIPDAAQTVNARRESSSGALVRKKRRILTSIRGRVDSGWTERRSACSIRGDPRGMECAAEPRSR